MTEETRTQVMRELRDALREIASCIDLPEEERAYHKALLLRGVRDQVAKGRRLFAGARALRRQAQVRGQLTGAGARPVIPFGSAYTDATSGTNK